MDTSSYNTSIKIVHEYSCMLRPGPKLLSRSGQFCIWVTFLPLLVFFSYLIVLALTLA
jgi:hypothetical protein